MTYGLQTHTPARSPLAFALYGNPSIGGRTSSQGRVSSPEVRSAEGVARRADAAGLELVLPPRSTRASRERRGLASVRSVTLAHNLPNSIVLSRLLGQSLRVTLVDESPSSAGGSQTLSISGSGGRVRLVARFGPAHGVVHSIGGIEVHAALSRRPTGPLVVGLGALQWLVYPGCHVRFGESSANLVVEHIARVSTESLAYVIADSGIYA
jgi:hypothetical protein